MNLLVRVFIGDIDGKKRTDVRIDGLDGKARSFSNIRFVRTANEIIVFGPITGNELFVIRDTPVTIEYIYKSF